MTSGVVVDHARGSAITDVDGNTLLDFVGGIGVNGVRAFTPDDRHGDQGSGRAGGGRIPHVRGAGRSPRAARHARAGAWRAPRSALLHGRRGRRERAPARQIAYRQMGERELLGRLPREDAGRPVADGLELQGEARAIRAGESHRALRGLLPLSAGSAVSVLRHRVRRGRAQASEVAVGRRDCGRRRRADAGDGGQRHSGPMDSSRRCARSPTTTMPCSSSTR